MARAAGVQINWQDMSDLSDIIPLMCHIYPNGLADINRFQAVGGMGFLIRSLLSEGLMHEDVKNIMGDSMAEYAKEPFLENDELEWRDAPTESLDEDVLRPAAKAFSPTGGMKLLKGNMGRCVIKVSAVKPQNRAVKAPASLPPGRPAGSRPANWIRISSPWCASRAPVPTVCPSCTN